MPSPDPDRSGPDLCPGALSVHSAADGGLARVRLPGGIVSTAQLATLAVAAAELGDGRLELTSRGNVQIRALAPGTEVELGDRLAQAGLLPSPTHERVRNIVASPLAGIDRDTELTDLVQALDAVICADARLAELPGRFLFAVDDGRGDVARLGADVALTVTGSRVQIGTLAVSRAAAASAAIAHAVAFLDERRAQASQAWRAEELDGGGERVAARAVRALREDEVTVLAAVPRERSAAATAEPVGPIAQVDGGTALAVLAPLGRLSAEQARLLVEVSGPRGLRITPWRSLVVRDVADIAALVTAADRAGLGVDASSRWFRVSACAGRPGCAKALVDVQADARAEHNRWPGQQVHWSGCARRCGRPIDTTVDLVATPEGYDVSERADEDDDDDA